MPRGWFKIQTMYVSGKKQKHLSWVKHSIKEKALCYSLRVYLEFQSADEQCRFVRFICWNMNPDRYSSFPGRDVDRRNYMIQLKLASQTHPQRKTKSKHVEVSWQQRDIQTYILSILTIILSRSKWNPDHVSLRNKYFLCHCEPLWNDRDMNDGSDI